VEKKEALLVAPCWFDSSTSYGYCFLDSGGASHEDFDGWIQVETCETKASGNKEKFFAVFFFEIFSRWKTFPTASSQILPAWR